ncbi:MAG: sulfurtransferase TusA family protein [Pseudomonadota bacterium]
MADRVVDARHLSCPLPTLKVKQALRSMDSGDTVKVHATDPRTLDELKAFAAARDHEILSHAVTDGVLVLVLKKGTPPA